MGHLAMRKPVLHTAVYIRTQKMFESRFALFIFVLLFRDANSGSKVALLRFSENSVRLAYSRQVSVSLSSERHFTTV